KSEERFVEPSILGIASVESPIPIVFTESTAPRVRRRTRNPVRQTFGQLQLQRVICGVAVIRVQRDAIELRVKDDEVFGEQPAVTDETSALTADVRAPVQEIRQTAHVVVRDKTSRVRVGTQ